MIADLGVICVAATLPVIVGRDLVRRALRARSVRHDVEDYLGWVEDDIRYAARAQSVPTGRSILAFTSASR